MKKILVLIPLFFSLLLSTPSDASPTGKTDRARERLTGLVQTVLVEISEIKMIEGKPIEAPRMPWTSTTYDRSGNRVEENQLYNHVSLNFKSLFTHDASGKLQEGIEFDAKGVVAFKWTYTHSPEENQVEERRSHPNGVLFSRTVYAYDSEGNLIEEKHFPPHTENSFKWVFHFDKAGRKREELYYLIRPDGRSDQVKEILNFRLEYAYDKEGNLIEEVRSDGAGRVEWDKLYEYKYDKKGNWVSQKAFQAQNIANLTSPVPIGMTYRTISYFQE